MRILSNIVSWATRSFGEMIEVNGKKITDECEYCGELTMCQLFRDGHGIPDRERSRMVELVVCQRKHKAKRMEHEGTARI